MTPERYEQLCELFTRINGLSTDERRRVLDETCADDPELRREVEELLLANEQPARLDPLTMPELVSCSVDEAAPSMTVWPPGSSTARSPAQHFQIEGYEILRELTRGGQGVVYEAIQATTKRKVAVKVLLEGPYASELTRRRFEREIELAARMEHPNIVTIFHSGTAADGRQYYVMDYVDGLPLDAYVKENTPPLEKILQIFMRICEAVQFAHHRGIIHRDLVQRGSTLHVSRTRNSECET